MSYPGCDVIVMVGLAMSVACLGIDIGPVPDCPSCSLRSESAAGRFKAAVAPRGGRSSLSARGQAREVCSGQDLLARNPALLAQPDRTCEAARPLPVPGRPHRRADRHGPEPLRNQGRNRHGQALYPQPLQRQVVATP